MPVSIECPNCASRFNIGDHLAGKRVKCKKCGGGIHVPDAPNLDKAKVLPLQRDPDEAPAMLELMSVFNKRPWPPSNPEPERKQAYPTAVAETFVARPAFDPEAATVGELPPIFIPAPRAVAVPAESFPVQMLKVRDIRLSTGAPEGFSPLVLFVFVGVQLALTVYKVNQHGAVGSTEWTIGICNLLLFFAAVAPGTWLGVWCAAKAMRFELASPQYIKAGALAAAPVLMLMFFPLLPNNPVMIGFAVVAMIPATFFLTMLFFALTLPETLVAFFLGAIGWLIGWFFELIILGLILVSANMTPGNAQTQALADISNNNDSTQNQSSQYPSPTGGSDAAMAKLNNIEQQVKIMSPSSWMSQLSKEQATKQWYNLQNQLEGVRPDATTAELGAKFSEVSAEVANFGNLVAELPTQGPDATVFRPIDNGSDWRPTGNDLTVPVSFKRYRMQVPTEANIDLNYSEDAPDGMTWTLRPHGQINITTVNRKNPKQARPWVKTKPFMKADDANLFTLDMANTPVDITYGKIGYLPATRIALRVSGESVFRFTSEQFVKYVVTDEDAWVIITCTAEVGDARMLSMVESAALSVRRARPDEPPIDPFTPEVLVNRLREGHAEAIVRKMGASAEPALLAHINDSDGLLRDKVLELLADCGTKSALPALFPMCSDEDTHYAELARAAVRKISPFDMDLTAEALLQIQSKNFQARQKAVAQLAAAQPKADDPRRAKVCAILTDMVRNSQESFGIKPETLGDAIGVWQTPDTVTSLLPLLDYKGDFMLRQTAMIVLAHSRDKRAVFPICRWLIEDTASAQDALVSMGPVAEDEVIKVLNEKNDKARLAAINILGAIGTQKSLKPLGYAVSDKRAPADVDAGNAAIAEVRQRIGKPNAPATPGAKPSASAGERPLVNDPSLSGNLWLPSATGGPKNPTR